MIWKLNLTKASLSFLFSLTTINLGVLMALSPKPVLAYTAQLDVTISPNTPEETFTIMLRRAEDIARAAAQRSFDSDILVTDVSITILIENRDSTVPVLGLKVNRENWQKAPDVQKYVNYYPASGSLLGFDLGKEAIEEQKSISNTIPKTVITPTTPTTVTNPTTPTNPTNPTTPT
ncbi:MAG TPA: hypothetical protein V6C58_08375, partial [Allocoleopsis sp.]